MAYLKRTVIWADIFPVVLLALLLTTLASATYFRAQATSETITVNNSTGEIYIRWHLKNFEYVTYYMHRTPTGVSVESVMQKNALPLTSALTYTWDFKHFVLAQKCRSLFQFETCSPPNDEEMAELESIMIASRRKGPIDANLFPKLPRVLRRIPIASKER
ncbi:MAG: hypothetical protein HYT37_03340 [Candidatus Sungbacteria bacterium]|nr:hypothetical protein [Candidatus Sungbacteria bacterium]